MSGKKYVTGEGTNAGGNTYRNYSDGSYTYKNTDGGRFYQTKGSASFYKAPSVDGAPRQSYYKGSSGQWKAVGGKKK